jgi:hypothetical protein
MKGGYFGTNKVSMRGKLEHLVLKPISEKPDMLFGTVSIELHLGQTFLFQHEAAQPTCGMRGF